jgi:hypothetical protein
MGTGTGRPEGKLDNALAVRADAAGVAVDAILEEMLAQLGAATSSGSGARGPVVAENRHASGVAAAQHLMAQGADALAEVFARTFASPKEALAYVPEVVAGITGTAAHTAAADRVTTVSTARFLTESHDTDANFSPPGSTDFASAFRAALQEGLRAAPVENALGAIVEELFAAAAAGAHALPGGAAAVHSYLREKGRDLKTQRWGNRVRALLRYVGPHRDRPRRLTPPRRVTARRARRRGPHRGLRGRSRSTTRDGEPPREPPRPPAARARERLPPRGGDL